MHEHTNTHIRDTQDAQDAHQAHAPTHMHEHARSTSVCRPRLAKHADVPCTASCACRRLH
eukprot:3704488-Alexandrium_andersonii.AAC.1